MEKLNVLVNRGNTNTQIPVTVPAYELPVLLEIHGDTFVQVKGSEKDDEKVDSKLAFDALHRKYGDVVNKVYRNPGEIAKNLRQAA